jgi:multidrug efflux pump subunit AcrA (membrane-fusion protein)
LAVKIKEIEGQFNTALQELNGIRARLANNSYKLTEQEHAQADAQFARVNQQVRSYKDQLDLLRTREEQLVVRAPIKGRIITWDLKKLLQNRPVETGQVLLTVAADNSDYQIELLMPERRVRHLTDARERLKTAHPDQDLKAEFFLMTDPGTRHQGTLVEVNAAAEAHEEQGNMVRVRIHPDEPLKSPRPGASVTADVHCGKAPLGWAMLHEAWEWMQASWFF